MARDRTWWTAKLAAARAEVDAIDAMLLSFATDGAVEEYRINTGQTDNRTRRAEMDQLERTRNALMIRIETLEVKLGNGCGHVRVRPGW